VKGLIVRQPWASLIVSGKKQWEIRRTKTRYRGPVAIISQKNVLGVVEIVDVIGLPVEEMAARVEKHCSDPATIKSYGEGRGVLYAWVLNGAKRLKEPLPIRIPRGAQTWVKIPESVEEEIWKSLEG